MIRILVVSPTPALRAGLRALLSSDPDLVVSTAAGLGNPPHEAGTSAPAEMALGALAEGVDEALEAGASQWDVVVATQASLDLAGLSLHPEQALLLVTDDLQETQALPGLELRAWGVISPETTEEALQAAVHALAEGLVTASPAIMRQVLAAGVGNGGLAFPGRPGEEEKDALIDPLTERENEVLLRLAQGLTNKQIALALGISEHTVKFHVSSIYSKLGVSNRTEAVRKGARRGWIPL